MALEYARSDCSLLLKLRTESFMQRGADLDFLSCFPGEKEILFPPLTYLKPTGKRDEVHLYPQREGGGSEGGGGDGAGCTVTVIEVVPHLGSA